MKKSEKPKYNVWQSIGFMLRRAWRDQKSVLVFCIVLAALDLCVNLTQLFIAPAILQKVEIAAPLPLLLWTIGGFALALLILTGLREYTNHNLLFGRVHVRCNILADLNEKGCTTAYPNAQDPEVRKLSDRAAQTCYSNDAAGEYFWTVLTTLITSIAGFAIYLMLLSNLDPVLMAAVLVTTIIGFAVSRRFNGWSYRHRDEFDKQRTDIIYFERTMESPDFAKDIRIFGLSTWLREVKEKACGMYAALLSRWGTMKLLNAGVDLLLAFFRNGLAYLYLIHRVLSTGMPASEFLLYFTAFTGFSEWVTSILSQCSELHKQCIELSAVQEYLNYKEPFRFDNGKPVPSASAYELQLEDVSFRYPGAEQDTIHNMNLTIHPGENLAVVGLNGAGKTTLVKLICGFYDPTEGRVLLNGQDIREFNRREYYKLFSAVFQDFSMPDLTVTETVAQDYENIDQQRVQNCIEKAGLAEMVQTLPKGFDTHLGKEIFLDGVRLSGGQTQRLMLARALYKDGPLLVLDEPTAALDPLAENDIYQKYNQMTTGKTSLFISHRLASTRFCDRILFLENGVIAEEGTHDELIAKGGSYAKLFEVQARYYQEGRDFA